MAAHYIAAIRAVCPGGRVALCGLSFGGVVAFEMARQLDAQGSPVALLALLDAAALGAHRLLPKSAQARGVLSLLGRRFGYHAENLLLARDRPRSDYLAARARTLRRRLLSAAWRAALRLHFTLARFRIAGGVRGPRRAASPVPQRRRKASGSRRGRYRPQPYGGDATLFRARDTPAIFVRDPALGWTGLVRSLAIVEVPGNHETLLMEPHVRALAGALRQSLDAVQERVQPRFVGAAGQGGRRLRPHDEPVLSGRCQEWLDRRGARARFDRTRPVVAVGRLVPNWHASTRPHPWGP